MLLRCCSLFLNFGFWSFEFVSDFELRASDLVAAIGRDGYSSGEKGSPAMIIAN